MASDVTLTVGAPAHGGHCVARVDGRVVFVRHALPGETVVARFTEHEPNATFWRADAITVLEASEDRVEHPWPQAGPGGVGGAELGHVSIEGQHAWKLAVLKEAFSRFAGVEFTGDVNAAPGDDTGLAYRTRVTAIGDAEGRAGMRLFRSHELRALDAMPLATERAEQALLSQRFSAGSRITVADPTDGDVFVTVDGMRWHGGRRDTRENAPRRVREQVRIGDTTHEFVVDADGFWQVHKAAPSLLATRVAELAGSGERALDLYAGAGLLTLALSLSFAQVTSVESDSNSVRAARRNLSNSGHVDVIEGDVRKTLRSGLPAPSVGHPNVAVLDPPRSGAGRETLDALVALGAPKLVYVACDPVALARDTALLAAHGYALTHVEAWDLFPMTHHVESLAVFARD